MHVKINVYGGQSDDFIKIEFENGFKKVIL